MVLEHADRVGPAAHAGLDVEVADVGGGEGLAPVTVARPDQRVGGLHEARHDRESAEPLGGPEKDRGNDRRREEGQASSSNGATNIFA